MTRAVPGSTWAVLAQLRGTKPNSTPSPDGTETGRGACWTACVLMEGALARSGRRGREFKSRPPDQVSSRPWAATPGAGRRSASSRPVDPSDPSAEPVLPDGRWYGPEEPEGVDG
jgi:hypothetical protein